MNAPAAAQSEMPAPLHRRTTRRALTIGALAGLEALLARVGGGNVAHAAASGPLDERTKVAHLLRRAGFGYSAAELEEYAALGYRGALDRLLNYEQVEDDFDARFAAMETGLNLAVPAEIRQWWLLRMRMTRRPLQEKMALFWHGLLTSGLSKSGGSRTPLMMRQNAFFRENAFADFATIMQGITRDGAMMVWLDLDGSRKKAPNENYARELMELFTVGLGNFSEEDVKEAARAFTGWYVSKELVVEYAWRQHDDGLKNFMGNRGYWSGEHIINFLVDHPATGWRLARRLWTHFAYANPDDTVLLPLVAAYESKGKSVKAMLEAMFTSDAFVSEQAYRARVKSPPEFMVGLLRGLEVETSGKGLQWTLATMGQDIFNPPNVAGWPGGAAWLSSGTWLERLNFVNRVVTNRQPDAPIKPVDFEQLINQRGLAGPAQLLDYLLGLFVDGRVSAPARAVLLDYLTDGGALQGEFSSWKDRKQMDRRIRGVTYLLLAMPEFHLN